MPFVYTSKDVGIHTIELQYKVSATHRLAARALCVPVEEGSGSSVVFEPEVECGWFGNTLTYRILVRTLFKKFDQTYVWVYDVDGSTVSVLPWEVILHQTTPPF
jgi:hypothetical protein